MTKQQDNILIGNQVNKAELKNPISRALVAGFDRALFGLLRAAQPKTIHEVGCGEGRLARMIHAEFPGVPFRGTDFSRELIAENQRLGPAGIEFVCKSIYDLDRAADGADTIICCEVLEHLEEPARGVEALRSLGAQHCILSVPNEPVWRVLNCLRGKYLSALGNTPGHLNHWSTRSFCRFVESHGFEVRARRQPFPWTMLYGRFSPRA